MILGWSGLIMSQLANIPVLAGSRIVLSRSELMPSGASTGLKGLDASAPSQESPEDVFKRLGG